jgi:hypothetical protein
MLSYRQYRLPEGGLALLRVWFATGALTLGLVPDIAWTTRYPDSFWNPPPGLSQVWGSVPPLAVLVLIRAGLIVGLLALLVGWRTKATSILVGCVGIAISSVEYGFGKIDHGSTVLWVGLVVMGFSGWGNQLSIDRRSDRSVPPAAWPSAFVTAWFAVGLTTAAIEKLSNGWLDFSTQAVQNTVAQYTYVFNQYGPLAPKLLAIEGPWAWEPLDWATVIVELVPLLLLLRPSRLARFIPVLVSFHVLNVLVLDINFAIFTLAYLPVALLLFDDHLLNRACGLIARALKRQLIIRLAPIVLGGLALTAWMQGVGNELGILAFAIPFSLPLYVALVKRGHLGAGSEPSMLSPERPLSGGTLSQVGTSPARLSS